MKEAIRVRQQTPKERFRRRASYVAFTKEDEATHEISVLIGTVAPPYGRESILPRLGLPGGARKRGLRSLWLQPRAFLHILPKPKFSEHPAKAAVREVREEIGITLRKKDLALALAVEQPNPLAKKKRKLFQSRNTRARQVSHVYVVPAERVPSLFDGHVVATEELQNLRPLTLAQARVLREEGKAHVSDEVLEGMQIAVEWHKIHHSNYPFEHHHFKVLLTKKDAEKLRAKRLSLQS